MRIYENGAILASKDLEREMNEGDTKLRDLLFSLVTVLPPDYFKNIEEQAKKPLTVEDLDFIMKHYGGIKNQLSSC